MARIEFSFCKDVDIIISSVTSCSCFGNQSIGAVATGVGRQVLSGEEIEGIKSNLSDALEKIGAKEILKELKQIAEDKLQNSTWDNTTTGQEAKRLAENEAKYLKRADKLLNY